MRAKRLSAYDAAPEAMKAVRQVEAYSQQCGLEQDLIELVKMRASQINGCAYCLDMHSKDARRHGVSEQHLYLLNAWHESPLYTARERAALGWTDVLTRVADTHAPDDVYDEVRRHFADKELVDLTTLIGLINLWNRLARVSLRASGRAGGALMANAPIALRDADADDEVAACFPVMRELHPHRSSAAELVARVARQHDGGYRLLDAAAAEGRTLGGLRLVLDTALDNVLAHRFYYRQGMLARALRFSRPIATAGER